jgi:hypothetical protein
VIGLVAVTGLIGGCKSGGTAAAAEPADPSSAATSAAAVVLPEPDPALAPLGFLTGKWASVNPNKTVNREHWMSPQGRTMVGAFLQHRRDGSASFYELSAIAVEKDGVRLYHRHMHRGLELEDRRKDVDVFRLVSVEPGKAVFEPVTGDAAGPSGIQTMTYRLDGPDRLLQELVFKPESPEKGFTTIYTREP